MIYINGIPFGNKKFPNNETNFEKPVLKEYVNTITMYFESNEDLFNLIVLRNYIYRQGISNVDLCIPYFPYSRMDREIGVQMFSLESITDILNQGAFRSITFFDPHSEVVVRKIPAAIPVPLADVFFKQKFPHWDFIMFPDKGAAAKYMDQFQCFNPTFKYIIGNKKRDILTGKITEYEINCYNADLKNSVILIVDDICSYGGTFLAAAEALQRYNPMEIDLWVSHCENNIFKGDLLKSDLISHIITTNSIIRTEKHEKLEELEVFGKEKFYA